MRGFIDIVETYAGAFNTRGKTCEVFRNPTSKEFRSCGDDVRGFLVSDELLVWNAFGALHQEVRENLNLPKDSISIEIYSDEGEAHIIVTDNTRSTVWHHNPEVYDEIVHHPVLNKMFNEISVSYYDEAIEGDWRDIEEELVEGDHTPDEYEADDEEHYDALAKTGFFGNQAAGCLVLAKSTGRMLVVLRSGAVEQPFTWGNVGGAHKAEESPEKAAQREFYEETGFSGSVAMEPLMVFEKGSFRYCNFLAIIEDEFTPSLGWEADDYKWVEFGDWPSPLHFGLAGLFNDAASVNKIKYHIGER